MFKTKSIARGSASEQFPGKLHDLMTYVEQQGMGGDIISWVKDGTAIMVHDPEMLLRLLPRFGLSQTKYRSFQRQLNMWHWQRITHGPFKGGWLHPYFIRGDKKLCGFMSRHVCPPTVASSFFDGSTFEDGSMSSSSMAPIPTTNTAIMSERTDSHLWEKLERNSRGMKYDFDEIFMKLRKHDNERTDMKLPLSSFEGSFFSAHSCMNSLHEVFDDGSMDPTPILEPSPIVEPLPIVSSRTDSTRRRNNNISSNDMNLLLEPLSLDAIDSLF